MVDVFRTVMLGLLGGVAGWSLTRAFLAPRIAWSSGIARFGEGTEENPYLYKVKVQNVGWFRSVTRLQLSASIYYWISAETNRVIRIPLSTDHIPRLIPGANNVGVLLLHEIDDYARDTLIRDGHRSFVDSQQRILEDAFTEEFMWHDAGSGKSKRPYLVINALAADGWTGIFHYRESMRYRVEDIYADSAFRAKQGFVARLWRKNRQTSADLRYRAYHSKMRAWRRPSLNVVPSRSTRNARQTQEQTPSVQ